MNRYKKLVSNTLIFAVGTFSSKVLVFLLVPVYTKILSTQEMGTADLIVQLSNLLIPLASIGISNAIIRFGLDRSYRKDDVFTTGLLTVGGGFLLLLVFWPLISMIRYVSDYTLLVYLYVLMSCLRSLCSQFVRAKEYVRLYALDGIFSTALVIAFNLLFLLGFHMGVTGYVLATIVSDAISAVCLFLIAKLYRNVHLRGFSFSTAKEMLRYAGPLIPTTLFWWVINVSDRYLVAYMLGSAADGLYAVAYKIPTIVVMVSGIFMEAWQMSAITEDPAGRARFFTKVFHAYRSVMFLTAACLIPLSKVIIYLIDRSGDGSYYPAWEYVPFLVLATAFSCMVTFLGSVYTVEKKSVASSLTALAGAGINIVLNVLLIPRFGVNGAAFATFVSYLTVFIIRGVDTHRMLPLYWNLANFLPSAALVTAQAVLMVYAPPYWYLYELICLLGVAVLNFYPLLTTVRRLIPQKWMVKYNNR